MNYIPTPPSAVKFFKADAKRRVRAGIGKHVDVLDAVAREFGYEHWHHVTLCHKHYLEFQGPVQPEDLSHFIALGIGEKYHILRRAIAEGTRVSADRRFLLFDHPAEDDVNIIGAAEDFSSRVDLG